MGIIQGIQNIIRRKAPRENIRSFFPNESSYSYSGLTYIEDNPTAQACINRIANTFSEMTIGLYARRANRSGMAPAVFHPLFKVIEDPSVEETPTLFYSTLIRHLLSPYGNAYIHLNRNARGQIVSFSLIPPNAVAITRNAEWKKIFNINGKMYTEYDILHIPHFLGYDGTRGIGPYTPATRTLIGQDNYMYYYAEKYLKNSTGERPWAKLTGVWATKEAGDTLKEKLEKLRMYFDATAKNAGRVNFLPPDTELSILKQPTNVESDLHSLQVSVQRQIAQSFSVPYELVSSENKYNSLEERQRTFFVDCIKPLADHLTESFEKLLAPTDSNLTVRFDYGSLLEPDYKTKAEVLANLATRGIIPPNKAVAELGFDVSDPTGDYVFTPFTSYPRTEENIQAFFADKKQLLNGDAVMVDVNDPNKLQADQSK